MSAPVFAALGLCTPLGLTAPATAHAVAAGVACFRDTAVIGRGGEPIRAAALTALEPASTRSERILFFGARAIRECADRARPGAFPSLPVFVALPEPGRGAPLADAGVLLALNRLSPPFLDWSRRPFASGRAGFFQALDAAKTAIAQRSAEAVLVVGMDSYCDPASLAQLDGAGRILGDGNPDGLIPGEGAGAVLLTTGSAASRAGLTPLAALDSSALGRDAEPFEKRTASAARGLTGVLRQLRRAQGSTPRADAVFSCQPGEGLWARELSIAHLRNPPVMPEPQRRFLLASTLGDAGAAAGPVQIGMLLHLAARSWRRNRTLERAIVYGAGDGGDVGACFVSVL